MSAVWSASAGALAQNFVRLGRFRQADVRYLWQHSMNMFCNYGMVHMDKFP